LQSVTGAGRDVTDASFEVGDADLGDVVITFTDRPASIAGTVKLPTAGDSDIAVFMFPANRARWPESRASTRLFRAVRTTKAGGFSFPNVLPGEYQLVAIPDALAGDWPDEQFITRIAGVGTLLRVSPGQAATTSLPVSVIK
jgi:hypothetical protein